MRGRVLNREMVLWVEHLLKNTVWEPDRQAAADLLATVQFLMAGGGELPDEPIVPAGLARPKPLDASGQVITPTSPKARPASKRPKLSLVPREPAPPAPHSTPHFDEDEKEPA